MSGVTVARTSFRRCAPSQMASTVFVEAELIMREYTRMAYRKGGLRNIATYADCDTAEHILFSLAKQI